ncbi:MAG: M15 family metallopeptidase [Chlorobi bacterium]|nr:M15 family metallopeptidase [Chlorobiota bacterium]
MRQIITLIGILVFNFSFAQQTKVYNDKLNIVGDIYEYKAQVDEDPNLELVDLEDFVPGIILDIRYATTNNFTGQQVYTKAKAFARWPVAEALAIVQEELGKRNLALKVYDAYRPYSATVLFYEIYKDTTYVASPWSGSRHNRGAAIDISIVDLETGEEIQMPTGYDDFTEAAHPDYMDLPQNVIQNRDFLINTMQKHGFKVYASEWWHFDFVGWEAFPLMDIPFDKL